MRVRVSVSILAALCVLVHAAVIVRHHVLLISALGSQQHSWAQQGLGAICHGASQADNEAPIQAPAPEGYQHCPICLGLAPAATLNTPAIYLAAAAEVVSVRYGSLTQAKRAKPHAVRPPTRGPPALA